MFCETKIIGSLSKNAKHVLGLENLDELDLGQKLVVVLVVLFKVAGDDLGGVLLRLAAQLKDRLVQRQHLRLVDLLVVVDVEDVEDGVEAILVSQVVLVLDQKARGQNELVEGDAAVVVQVEGAEGELSELLRVAVAVQLLVDLDVDLLVNVTLRKLFLFVGF